MNTVTPPTDVAGSYPLCPEEHRPSPPIAGRGRALTVLLVDPRQLTRESLAQWLQASARDFRIVPLPDAAEPTRKDSAAARGGGGVPDLILLNIAGAGVTEPRVAQTIEVLRRGLPDVPLVVLGDREDTDAVAEAIRCGARGYIPTTLHAAR